MKVYRIIEVAKWVDGSGFEYSATLESGAVDIVGDTAEEIKDGFDWDWWEKSEQLADGEDLRITVKYYSNPDYDPMLDDDELIAVFETWESEL